MSVETLKECFVLCALYELRVRNVVFFNLLLYCLGNGY